MSWEIWDPFEDMKKIQNEVEQSFRDFYRLPSRSDNDKKHILQREPLIDIYETDKDVVAKIELPGIEKKDIELNVSENMINLKAQRKTTSENKGRHFYRCERSYTGFQRAFSLPAKVLPDKTFAELKDGVLLIKAAKEKPKIEHKDKHKKIDIK